MGGRSRVLQGDKKFEESNLEFFPKTGAEGKVLILEDAKRGFQNRAERLAVELKYRVQYDQPEEHPAGWTTNFRYLKPDFKYGLPKGGCVGEELQTEAAVREFREEVGVRLKASDLTEDPIVVDKFNFYVMKIPASDKAVFAREITRRKDLLYSELFDIAFMSIGDVPKNSFNWASKAAINKKFPPPPKGGSRKEPIKNAFLNRMIQIHTVEQRTMVQGGQPPITIVRQVDMKNGHGVKQVQVIRGNTILAQESAPLNLTEKKNVQQRKTSSLHKSLERKTLKSINASKKKAAIKQRVAKQTKKAKKAKKAAKKN